MGGPTVIAWGSEELKQRFLRGIATNEEIWCQLFSEPGAGSDLAGLATRAVRDGDEWVVNGQKVWTTLAHLAALRDAASPAPTPTCRSTRASPTSSSTCTQPGVEVRPLRQITGDAEFNEVFFTDVAHPRRLAARRVGDGWRVAITTLMNERVSLSGAGSVERRHRRRQPGRNGSSTGNAPVARLRTCGSGSSQA